MFSGTSLRCMWRSAAHAAAHAAQHRPHPLHCHPARPPHTMRATCHLHAVGAVAGATLAPHAAGRSSSLLLPPGHVRKHVEWQRRAAPPASASAELREPKALEAAERLLLGAPGSRQHPSNRCSRVGAPRRSLRPSSSEEVSTCRHPPAATPCPPSQQRPRPPQLVETGEGSGPFERLHKLTRGRFETTPACRTRISIPFDASAGPASILLQGTNDTRGQCMD